MVENLCVALCLERGRSRWCATLVGLLHRQNVEVCVWWTPSELKPADPISRPDGRRGRGGDAGRHLRW